MCGFYNLLWIRTCSLREAQRIPGKLLVPVFHFIPYGLRFLFQPSRDFYFVVLGEGGEGLNLCLVDLSVDIGDTDRHDEGRAAQVIVAEHRGVLLEAGLQHFHKHFPTIESDGKAALHCRDGMMMALLALMPMRRRPFVGLGLGRSLVQTLTGWQVTLGEADLKRGSSWESAVPQILVSPLSSYVDQIRPILAATAQESSNHLWLSISGRPMDAPYVGVRMKELTVRLIGRDISCHLFRDCAATTLAITSPDMARLTKGLLGQSSDRTATRYYNQATSLEAGRLLSDRVDAIRRTT